MIELNACSCTLNPVIIRSVLSRIIDERGMLPAKCKAHPAQMAAFDWMEVVDHKNPLAIPIVVDVREVKTELRFFSANDEELGKITCLAIPVGFGEL